jgi:hypothetical protein
VLSEKHEIEAQTATKCNRLITNLHPISVLMLILSESLFVGGGSCLQAGQEAKNANNFKIF